MTTPSVHSPVSVEPATPGSWLARLDADPRLCGRGLPRASDPFAKSPSATTDVADNADPTSLATVTRQDLSSQTQVPATLGYAGSYSVVNQAQGTVTSLPAVGQVVSQGQVLYQVNGQPVVLLYGSTPAYRTLSSGTDRRRRRRAQRRSGRPGLCHSTELHPGIRLTSPTGPRSAWRSSRPPSG